MKKYPVNSKELELRAMVEGQALEVLRKVVVATAIYQAERMIANRNLKEDMLPELIESGMGVFDQAFNRYVEKGTISKAAMNFSPYFGWWARQAITSHLAEE